MLHDIRDTPDYSSIISSVLAGAEFRTHGEKVSEEFEELRREWDPPAKSTKTQARRAEELGDLLFALVNVARFQKFSPEDVLRQAVEKFGVEFLLRIHFRKNEFNKIKYLVNTRRVARESDLIFIRDTVRTLQNRALEKQDPDLRLHLTALQNLLASVHVKLQMIALERKRD